MRAPLQSCFRRSTVAVLASGVVISMSALTGGVAPALAKPGTTAIRAYRSSRRRSSSFRTHRRPQRLRAHPGRLLRRRKRLHRPRSRRRPSSWRRPRRSRRPNPSLRRHRRSRSPLRRSRRLPLRRRRPQRRWRPLRHRRRSAARHRCAEGGCAKSDRAADRRAQGRPAEGGRTAGRPRRRPMRRRSTTASACAASPISRHPKQDARSPMPTRRNRGPAQRFRRIWHRVSRPNPVPILARPTRSCPRQLTPEKPGTNGSGDAKTDPSDPSTGVEGREADPNRDARHDAGVRTGHPARQTVESDRGEAGTGGEERRRLPVERDQPGKQDQVGPVRIRLQGGFGIPRRRP